MHVINAKSNNVSNARVLFLAESDSTVGTVRVGSYAIYFLGKYPSFWSQQYKSYHTLAAEVKTKEEITARRIQSKVFKTEVIRQACTQLASR